MVISPVGLPYLSYKLKGVCADPRIMSDLAIRVDILHEDNVSSLVGLLDSLGGSYWIVREGGVENPHLHVHLRTDRSLNAVRLAFKRKFTEHVGNGHYSIKLCDSDVSGYDRYMAKGGGEDDDPIIIARQGVEYTMEWVQQQHVDYWCVNAELMAKRRRKMGGNVTDQLLQRCLDKGIKGRGGIGNEYLSLCLESNRSINIFAGKAAINTVWLKLCDTSEARDTLLGDLVGYHAAEVPRM